MPRVSVIIPAYNAEAYVAAAVGSVLTQTYTDFECIVVDDGSTDRTPQILAQFGPRIACVQQPNRGESAARNLGLAHAQGEYVAFLDADDLWSAPKLERQVAIMDALPAAILAYAYSDVIDDTGTRIRLRGRDRIGHGSGGLHAVFEQLAVGNMIANPGTVLVRRQRLEPAGAFDPTIRWGEDWDLWLRLSLDGPFAFVPQTLASYRVHDPTRRLRIEAADEFVEQSEQILRKTFSLAAAHAAHLESLRARAFGALYLRSAVFNFELDNHVRGSRHLAQAFEADPQALSDPQTFVRRGVDEAFRIATERSTPAAGLSFLHALFDQLPAPAAALRAQREPAIAELHAALAATAFDRGQRGETLRHVARAIRTRPQHLRDRGLVSIGAQAILGGKPWTVARHALRRPARRHAEHDRAHAMPGGSGSDFRDRLTAVGWAYKAARYAPDFVSATRGRCVESPAISVIVVSWRPVADTARCLEAVAAQRAANLELVVVDNGAPDGAFEPYHRDVDTYVRLNRNTGASFGRNVGAVFANAPILLFLDDDGIPAADLVAAHLDAFARYRVVAVRGACRPKTANPLNHLAEHYDLGDRPFPVFADVEGNTAYEARTFYEVGGWDEDIWGGEGMDLSLRLLRAEPDQRVQIYSPNPVLLHDFARDQAHLLAKQDRNAHTREVLRQRHPQFDTFLASWARYRQREDQLIPR